MSSVYDSAGNKIVFDDKNRTHFGFIAQYLQLVLPDLVQEDSEGFLAIEYNSIIPLLVEAVKELNAKTEENTKLKNDIEVLEGKVEYIISNCCNGKNIEPSTKNATTNQDLVNMEEEFSDQNILYQNEPNPFSDNTIIRCNIQAKINNAKLYIYNLQGSQIKSYDIEDKGMVEITISGSSLKPGMYIYTLVTDGQEIGSKRMILTD